MIASHGGDVGDLLASLPVMVQMGPGELVLHPSTHVREPFDAAKVQRVRSFFELQPYVTGVRFAKEAVGLPLDSWRGTRIQRHARITDWHTRAAGLPDWPHDKTWLTVDAPNKVARFVINRTARYHGSGVDWAEVVKRIGAEAVFVGTRKEHVQFTREYGAVAYYPTPCLLDVARVIAGAERLFCNQSTCCWLAHGLGVPVTLEEWQLDGNSRFDRPNCEYLDGNEKLVVGVDGRTLITRDRLRLIARLAKDAAELPGDLAELGTYKGGSAKIIASMAPQKTLHVFDTFKGLPTDDEMKGGHKRGDFAATSLTDVKQYLDGHNVIFHVGCFPQTTFDMPIDAAYSFVHLDADTYQSTTAGIAYFWPRLVPGGYLVCDDYGWKHTPGVRRAIEELLPDVELHLGKQQAWARKQST